MLDSSVYALAVTPDDSQVLLGGFFQHINGVLQDSSGAVDPVNGTTNQPWDCPHLPAAQLGLSLLDPEHCDQRQHRVLRGYGNGGGCFDGDFALTLGSTDSLLWQNHCLGATQALEVVNGFLFKGSHAHDCACLPGGFPEAD